LNVTVISRGDVEENRAKRGEYGLTQVLLQADREVSEAYQAWGTPSAVLVRADGTIGSYVAQGSEAIRALVSRQIVPAPANPMAVPMAQQAAGTPCPHCGQVHPAEPAGPPAQQGLPVGTLAPELKLPDITGKEVDLADYRGRDTLVLFWNPGCGFCQQLLPDLKAWEQNRPEKAPAVLVISTGEVEANAAHGLMSTIVLDNGWKAGAAFGASGTPSAVLVDREGKIASPIGVGGQAVLQLANGQG
jgi:peroxiredoxin